MPRSSYYYKPHEDLHKRYMDATAKDEIMQIYSETPFYGIRRITRELHRRGYRVNHKRVRRLRRETGLRTIYPRPHFNTSEPHPEHGIAISMDGRGRCRDNAKMERFWWALKYEDIKLKDRLNPSF